MRDAGVTFKVFKKEHDTWEIAHYIFDFDSPDLHLRVKFMWHVLKAVWIILNVVATLMSCLILVLLTMPEFYSVNADQGNFTADLPGFGELLCVLFFTADYGIRFFLTPMSKLSFIVDPHNLIDLLTTVPYFVQIVLAALGINLEIFRVLFLFRTFRLIKLGRYHRGLHQVLQTIQMTWDLLLFFLFAEVLLVFITAAAFFYAESDHYDVELARWVRKCQSFRAHECRNGFEVVPYQSILESMYWSVVTITTVGYRAEAPVSPLGKVIAAGTAVLGLLFFAAPATVLSTNYKILRRQAFAAQSFKNIDIRTTAAMKAQERLKRELELANRHRDSDGRVKIRNKRVLKIVGYFQFDGVRRPLYEVIPENLYVYPPLIAARRDEDGDIMWTDDFNPTTAQRILTMLVVFDSEDARKEARATLEILGLIPDNMSENEVLVCADPMSHIEVRHGFEQSYPELPTIVEIDQLDNSQGGMQDLIPVRFVINMPHLYPAVQVIALLKETRLTITVQTRMIVDELDIPLDTDIIMASRFVRELSEIAYRRVSDDNLIAYIHHSDAAALLTGFSNQFIPTPTEDYLIMDGYVVDQQVLSALLTSFPQIKLNVVGPEAANSFYSGQHLSVDLSDEYLMEVNLTALSNIDDLGFGHRFRLQVPVCKVKRTDVQFQLV